MKRIIVAIVELVTFRKVRGQHFFNGQPSLRWWYVGTKKYGHGGWIYLSRAWFRRFKDWDGVPRPESAA